MNKPTKATNYGAQLTVESIVRKIKRMLTEAERSDGYGVSIYEKQLEWISKRGQRTAKRVGGVGRK